MMVPIHPKEPDDPELLVNTRIEYLYRDAGNWKQWNEVTVPGRLTDAEIQEVIGTLDDGCNFVPSKLGLPEQRLGTINEDDGPYFELTADGFVPTAKRPDLAVDVHELARKFKDMKGHWLDGSPWPL